MNALNKIRGLFVFMALLWSTIAWAGIAKRTQTIVVGQQISIPADGVVKYSEGVDGVVDVRLPDDGKEFIVVGVAPGNTTLLLIFKNGRKEQINFIVKPLESKVPHKENIRLDFYFVELTERGNSNFGVSWPESIGGGTAEGTLDLVAGTTAGFLQITGHALPRLDVLQSTGWAKVMRQTAVISANGSQARFSSGGELNIPVQGSLAAEIRQIEFGTTVRVLPRYDKESGRLELDIESEFSSLTGDGAVPGRSRSTLSTIVNVELGQAIVLAGINAQSEGSNRTGVPFLSKIPLLGRLFSSDANRNENVQTVVFIVPSVVNLVGAKAQRGIREALDAYIKYDGGRPWLVKAGAPEGAK